MLLISAIREFTSFCATEKGLSNKTINAYRTDLNQFLSFTHTFDAELHVHNLDKEIILSYLSSISDIYKPQSITRKYASIRALFNYIEYEDIISHNPIRKIRFQVRKPRTLPRDIPSHEVHKLLTHLYDRLHSHTPPSSAYYNYIRDICAIELLYSTGIRVSELSHARRADIDLQQGFIRVLGKGQRERVIPICCAQVVDILQIYDSHAASACNDRTWFLLNRSGRRLSEQSIRNIVSKHCRSAGIDQHVTPHMFRHACATQLLRNGMDIRGIQAVLGHSSITTTQIYTHFCPLTQRQSIELCHPRRAIPAHL